MEATPDWKAPHASPQLPKHVNEFEVLNKISLDKDVDGARRATRVAQPTASELSPPRLSVNGVLLCFRRIRFRA